MTLRIDHRNERRNRYTTTSWAALHQLLRLFTPNHTNGSQA